MRLGNPVQSSMSYEKPPPGMIKEDDDKPEDCIPDLPGNEGARDFLAHAPTKGLWMPLGKEVKVMQCWRCKNFGHRTGDRECPYFISGNQKLEQFRVERMRDHADATTTDDRTPCNNHQAGVFPSSQGTLPQSRTFSLRLSGKYSPGRPSRYTTTQNRRAHLAHEDPMYDLIRENKRFEKETRIQQLKQMLEDTTSDSKSSSSADSGAGHRKKRRKEKKRKKKKIKKKKHKARKSSASSE
ncbi:retinitis pigmentosa 9 protein isoform X2 [Scyliorhinus torazame]|uniref:retinitis pigmentosa 9 protein isoform X2 n=1 Tax=Scyliorhinus torazame TaxID=75743 RepID=UPI003B5A9151